MPVTFAVAEHPAKPFPAPSITRFSCDQSKVLSKISTAYVPTKILQSSVDGTRNIYVQKNGFVQGSLLAYNRHHNLVIRPDDVWIAILSQLNIYINAHAEEQRSKFVSHADKKKLIVVSESSTVEGMDFGDLSVRMSQEIHENVKDKLLVPWVLPNFTTTTANDTIVCSVLLMSTLKEYFSYEMRTCCGIPFITLEGTVDDWQSILDRIDKIKEFGAEPTEWAGMLRAVLSRFVRAFVNTGGPHDDIEFWQRMIHEQRGSGTYWLGGWISVFCAWNDKGVFLAKSDRNLTFAPQTHWAQNFNLDGHLIPRVAKYPDGYAEVDVLVVDTGKNESWECSMLAGHIGISLTGDKLDTIHMAPQWFMYMKGEARGRGM